MRKLTGFIIMFLVSAMLLTSCIIKDGAWKDNIKLSARSVEFNAQADSVIITTKGEWWWVCSISVDSNFFSGFTINPDSENYKIEQDCFVVERSDKHTLFIRLDENPVNTVRIVRVGLEAGDYFDTVTITQKAKQ
ncbi:MAG: hypothetical protein IPN68_00770 [Bacteroidetes bacterium]|nr:hypothetical protein [Bacteroidota bacterium]